MVRTPSRACGSSPRANQETNVPCDETQLSAALLATSQSMLEMRWKRRGSCSLKQTILPSQPQWSSTPSEEDLIILVSATVDAFRPATDVLREAEQEAARTEGTLIQDAGRWLTSVGERSFGRAK